MAGALNEAVDRLWETFGDRDSLVTALPADACLARASSGELKAMLPRLCELMVDPSDAVPSSKAFDLCTEADWTKWPAPERFALEAFADTWWLHTITGDTSAPSADDVLAILSHLDTPLVRFLGPWIDEFDGPAAHHLAEAILHRFSSPHWAGREDERSQVEGWTRTEAVILGITMVGGVHLDDGVLSRVLDRLL